MKKAIIQFFKDLLYTKKKVKAKVAPVVQMRHDLISIQEPMVVAEVITMPELDIAEINHPDFFNKPVNQLQSGFSNTSANIDDVTQSRSTIEFNKFDERELEEDFINQEMCAIHSGLPIYSSLEEAEGFGDGTF